MQCFAVTSLKLAPCLTMSNSVQIVGIDCLS